MTTTVTDPKLYSTTTTSDVWGRTIRVDPPTGPAVGYVYDVKGQLLKAIRGTSAEVGNCLANPTTNCPASKTVSIQYDSAGRKLNMTDPDMGFWEYEYDALGNLEFQTDNRMCVLSLGYDALNRLTSKTSSGTGCVNQISTSYFYDNDDPATPLVYDPPTSGNTQIGRRTHMSDGSGSTTWEYDARGRVVSEVKNINDAPSAFETSWTYNSADLPVTMIYPVDNEELTYGYNSDGSLNSVTSSLGDTYLAGTKYDEAGRIKSMDYGASIIRKVFTYFPYNTAIQGGLLDTAVTTRLSDSVPLQSFAYTYDKNANVSTIVDNLAGPQTQTFGYDTLNRLTSAVVTGGAEGLYDESYEYDPNTGNLSLKGDVTYTAYDPNHPHAVKTLSNGNSYVYDDNGSMIVRNVDALTFDLAYDAENRLVSVASNATPPPPTVTPSPTFTATHTPSSTPTVSLTPTVTATASNTPTATATNTPTASATAGGPTNTPTDTATPTLTSTPTQPASDLIFADGFESGNLSAWSWPETDGGDLSVSAPSAAIGNYGMQAVMDDTAEITVVDETPNNETHYSARFYFDPNSADIGSGGINLIAGNSWPFCLYLQQEGVNYSLILCGDNDAGGWLEADPVLVTNGWQAIEIEWQAASAPGANDGYIKLWVGDVLVRSLLNIDNDTQTIAYVTLGVWDVPTGTNGTVYFDAFESHRGSHIGLDPNGPEVYSPLSPPDLIFADNFESGDLTNWSSVTGGGDLSVSASAAHQSSYGLQALVNDTANLRAVDESPVMETHYRARFYFHPNSLVMSAGTSHAIFDGFNVYNNTMVFRTELFYESGSYKLRNRVLKDDWGYTNGTKYVISNDWHVVEVEWQASSAPGSNNGFLSLWIDGVLMGTISNVDNDDLDMQAIGEVRLGAVAGVDSTSSGTMYFDHFESRRDSYIGPLAYNPPTYALANAPRPSQEGLFQPVAYHLPAPLSAPLQQSGPVFTDASFTYNGDGQRVKSEITTNIATTTTYFVGNHYEVADGVVTKYYYAGSQRIAMRQNGDLKFLLGDHLGSTSLVTDANGNNGIETRYKAWGEVRYASGDMPTRYSFTGQYSHTSDFGLLFYNARWVDPSLGRFTQADTIIPDQTQGIQAYDRYAYANNTPLLYTDPSGHFINLAFAAVGAITGAAIGAASVALPQMIKNVQSGQPLTTNINPSEVGKAAAIGAVAGAVGGLTFGVGLAAGSAIAGAVGITASSGAVATVTGAVTIAGSGVLAGQASRAATNVMTDKDLGIGLFQPEDMAIDAVFSLVTFKAIGGNFNQVMPSSTTGVGAYAQESIPSQGVTNTNSVRSGIQTIGNQYGCHTCGTMNPKGGVYYGDHQPPTALGTNQPRVIYPQCPSCSSTQGSHLRWGISGSLNHIWNGAWRPYYSWGPAWKLWDQ